MDWRLGAIYLANLLCCLICDLISPFYPIEALKKGLSTLHIGIVFALMPLTASVMSPIVGASLRRLGRRLTLTAGTLMMVCVMQATSMGLMSLADCYVGNFFFYISCLSWAAVGLGTACINTVCTV